MRLLALLLVLVLAGCGPRTASLQRVAVIGASATCGWGLHAPPTRADITPHRINLSHVLDAAIIEPHDPVAFHGDPLFFARPAVAGRRSVDQLLAIRPTQVVALDFLFWYAYGSRDLSGVPIERPRQRMAGLEAGLAELERLDVPLLVGDIPNMSPAVGVILSASMVPDEATIAAMNHRIADWARGRADTRVFPLADLLEALYANQAFAFDGQQLEAGARDLMLQNDQLHPTLLGLVAIGAMIADDIDDRDGSVDLQAVRAATIDAARR